ncbi:MAG TPA: hypothetical protein PKA27_06515 [Fimbriimonadaceae bacterium]|nr:hypothetical protein [Fimbriimonadaceae bacterium]
MERTKAERTPCPICGKADYEWGVLSGQHNYVADGSGVLARIFVVPKSIETRRCRLCGNLQLFKANP